MDRRHFLNQAAGLVTAATTTGIATRFGIASPSSKHPKIRVGVIGTAHAHAAGKLATIRKLADDFELVGIVEPQAELRADLASQRDYIGIPLLSERELFASSGLQAVVVETAIRDLLPTAHRCVSAGLHVHLDKPAGESLPEFENLLTTAKKRRVHVQMGYMLRYNPAFEWCVRLVRDGVLGKVFEVDGVMSKQVDNTTRARLARYRGGAMFELGCHLIDALVSILGPPEKVTAIARSSGKPPADLADNQLAIFEYPSATATIRSTVIEPHGTERRQFVVCGEKGTFEIRPLEPPVAQLTLENPAGEFAAGKQQLELAEIPGRYDRQLVDFAAVVRGDHQPQWTAEHDLVTQRTILLASGLAVT